VSPDHEITPPPKYLKIVIAFKCTETICSLEAITTETDLCDGCMIHGGFATTFDEMHTAMTRLVQSARQSYPDFSIVTTGHSLGAAMATMAGAWLRHDGYPCDIYTYGSPRIGNEKLADYISQQAGNNYRITHINDPVPRLPGHWLGYRHTDMEYWLSDGDATTVDYGVSDIKICEGTYNNNCNGAGNIGTSFTPHGYYFRKIGACKS
jgi:predicted lipase